MSEGKGSNHRVDERLFAALAEQIKLPFLEIARQAELAQSSPQPKAHLADIELSADTALQLLDSYLLGVRLSQDQAALELVPVSVASILTDTAHRLHKLAAQSNCQLELHLSGKYEPVLADQQALETALTSLGAVFIEAQTLGEADHQPVLKLAAHRSKSGIVAGLFADIEGLSSDMYRCGRALYGRARQPLSIAISTAGAGVFVADSILSTMSAPLHLARHQKLNGLAVTLTPSQQLELV